MLWHLPIGQPYLDKVQRYLGATECSHEAVPPGEYGASAFRFQMNLNGFQLKIDCYRYR